MSECHTAGCSQEATHHVVYKIGTAPVQEHDYCDGCTDGLKALPEFAVTASPLEDPSDQITWHRGYYDSPEDVPYEGANQGMRAVAEGRTIARYRRTSTGYGYWGHIRGTILTRTERACNPTEFREMTANAWRAFKATDHAALFAAWEKAIEAEKAASEALDAAMDAHQQAEQARRSAYRAWKEAGGIRPDDYTKKEQGSV